MQKMEVRINDQAVGHVRQLGGMWVAVLYADRYLPPMYGTKSSMLDYVRRQGRLCRASR